MQKLAILFIASLIVAACASKTHNYKPLFDQVYILNLDRTPQRYLETKANFDKAGVKHIRFSATDGYAIKVKDMTTGQVMNGKEMWTECRQNKEAKVNYKITCDNNPLNDIKSSMCLTPGEVGVYCSMRRIWRDALDNNYRYSLILEDDSRIQPEYIKNFNQEVRTIVEATPQNWDIIFLHMYHQHEKLYTARQIGTKQENSHVFGINRDPNLGVASCAAYIINRSFAEKMLSYTDKMFTAIDLQVSDAINKKIITGYKAKKKLIIPDEKEVNSVINEMGRNNSNNK